MKNYPVLMVLVGLLMLLASDFVIAKGRSQSGISIGVPNPNPFTSTTKFNVTLQKEQKVTVALYDSNGKMVKMVNDGNLRAGTHSFTINADNLKLKKGRYFIVAKSGNQVRRRPIIFNP